MPVYDVECKKCKKKDTILWNYQEYDEFKKGSIQEKCKNKDCDGDLRVLVGNYTTIIPDHMSAAGGAGDNEIKYDKSPSKRKRFYSGM